MAEEIDFRLYASALMVIIFSSQGSIRRGGKSCQVIGRTVQPNNDMDSPLHS